MQINWKLLPMKAHFFLFNGGSAPVVPFIPVIAKSLGFSAFVTSTFFTIATILSLFAKPCIGALADKLKRQKAIFIILLILIAAIYFSIQFVPALPLDSSILLDCTSTPKLQLTSEKFSELCFIDELKSAGKLKCQLNCDEEFIEGALRINATTFNVLFNTSSLIITQNNASFDLDSIELEARIKPICFEPLLGRCQMECNDFTMTELLNKPVVNDNQVFGYSSFWILMIMIVSSRIFANVVTSIGDRPNDFGKQRLWGSNGWGLTALISGLIVDYVSEGLPHKNFTIAFYFTLVLLLLDIVVCKTLEYKAVSKPVNVFKDVGKVISNIKVVVYMIWCMLCGIYMSIVFYFLFWYLEDVASEEGCNNTAWMKTLEGLVLTFHCYLGELPFFLISGWMLKKFGHINCMTIVLMANGLRFVLYSYLTNPWYTLPIETLNGITFGTFYATMTTYANKVAPLGTETTVQNLVCAMYDGLGSSIGTLLGGYMLQNLGGRQTYWIFGLSAIFFAVIHVAVQFFLNKNDDTKNQD